MDRRSFLKLTGLVTAAPAILSTPSDAAIIVEPKAPNSFLVLRHAALKWEYLNTNPDDGITGFALYLLHYYFPLVKGNGEKVITVWNNSYPPMSVLEASNTVILDINGNVTIRKSKQGMSQHRAEYIVKNIISGNRFLIK